jgi:glycosyltransferase involved in cell wall biosynthesis
MLIKDNFDLVKSAPSVNGDISVLDFLDTMKKSRDHFESIGLKNNDGKIHVLFIAGDFGGCGYVRIDLPAKYLNRLQDISAFPTLVVRSELIHWADVIVWQRQHKEELLCFVDLAKKLGKIQIFDLDDNLHAVPRSNPAYYVYNSNTKEYYNMLKYINMCDCLQVSRQSLGEYYKKRWGIKKYIVLPNSIDIETLPPEQKNDTNRLRIGWVGSSTHQEDLAIIENAIQRLSKEYDFDFITFGWDGKDMVKIGEELRVHHDYLEGTKREYHPFVKLEQYMTTLASLKLDIGLCPVVDNIFNSTGKSGIKWMEYSSLHIPSVVSKVGCYTDYVVNGETALIAKDNEWYKQIKKLIESHELRKKIAEQAYNEVRDKYNISQNIQLWANLYRQYAKNMRYISNIIPNIQGN